MDQLPNLQPQPFIQPANQIQAPPPPPQRLNRMAYHGMSKSRFIVLRNSPWYDVEELIAEVSALRRINFSIVESRQQALERINNITIHHPFKVNERFLDDKVFICETFGDWARKFQQLKSALSLKERDKELMAKHQALPAQKGEQSIDASSDSHQAFWNATTSILDQLTRLDGCFDRETFERHFGLDWH